MKLMLEINTVPAVDQGLLYSCLRSPSLLCNSSNPGELIGTTHLCSCIWSWVSIFICILMYKDTHTHKRSHASIWQQSSTQQQVHSSFSGFFLFPTLNEPLCARVLAAEGFLCLFSLAATAKTMSSTLSSWYSPCCPCTRLTGGFLADVSKNIMPWALAKLIACSWLTCRSFLPGSRRSLLLPSTNLEEQQNK